MIFAKLNIILSQFLSFFFILIVDLVRYYKNKGYKEFKGFGLHIYVGKFGSGKTSSLVHDAYERALRYPQLTILTNMELKNFPKHTKILPLTNYQMIIDAPKNTLIIIDEISTVFNSRDWKTEGIPAALLGMLLQVRKERKMIYATAQVFSHVDSLIRGITFSVRECKCIAGRWNIVKVYDAKDYETKINNTVHQPKLENIYGFIQTNFIRNLYDTSEMVEKMKKTKYITDSETLQKQAGKVISTVNT